MPLHFLIAAVSSVKVWLRYPQLHCFSALVTWLFFLPTTFYLSLSYLRFPSLCTCISVYSALRSYPLYSGRTPVYFTVSLSPFENLIAFATHGCTGHSCHASFPFFDKWYSPFRIQIHLKPIQARLRWSHLLQQFLLYVTFMHFLAFWFSLCLCALISSFVPL